MQKEEAIEYYLQAGYRIFPVNGKVPAHKGWQNVKENPFLDIKSFTKNYGICLQSDDLVIDVDVSEKKDGTTKKGRASFDALVKATGLRFKDTFGVRTGTGGFHFYFKKPKDLHIKETWRNYPDIEFKSRGRYVVGAESIHPKTHEPYKIVVGSVLDVKDAPTALLDLIKHAPVDLSDVSAITKFADDEQSILRCKSYLNIADAAIEGEGGDKQTYMVACRCREFGLAPQTALDLMIEIWNPKCVPAWDLEELRTKVYNAYSYDTTPLGHNHPETAFKDIPAREKKEKNYWATEVRKDGTRKAHIHNTYCYINETDELRGLFKYNLFTDTIEFNRVPPWYAPDKPVVPWVDNDAILLKHLFTTRQKYEARVSDIHEGVFVYSHKRAYHPLKDYLNGLKWDKKERIGTWLHDYAGVKDDEYSREVGAKTLLGAIKRVYEPGCKFDTVLVLEGEQGAGKSRLITAMGKDWYGDIHLDPHNKDTVAAMRNKWIIELSEMAFTKKAEVNAMKSFLSRNTDRHRLSHRRDAEDYPRQCIFIGTINPDQVGYLTDNTGNRRFWPVSIPEGFKVKVDKMENNIDQIWAEAVYKYKHESVDLHITDDRIDAMAQAEAKKRTPVDEWLSTVEYWLNNFKVNGEQIKHVSSIDIWSDCLNGVPRNIKRMDQVRITNIMRELKWKKGTYSDDGKSKYGYTRPRRQEE
ncbi:MAG: hypothetical protein HOL31_01990 [Candidatus Scalindua sp.]|jgi:predicted P-loop ATPase|nr:hypothetical protein [Candidatus Scalindua sp.]